MIKTAEQEHQLKLAIWATGSVSVWQADRKLSGTGAVGGFEWESATAGTHHETRELSVTFPVGGSGASHGAQPSGMAQ